MMEQTAGGGHGRRVGFGRRKMGKSPVNFEKFITVAVANFNFTDGELARPGAPVVFDGAPISGQQNLLNYRFIRRVNKCVEKRPLMENIRGNIRFEVDIEQSVEWICN